MDVHAECDQPLTLPFSTRTTGCNMANLSKDGIYMMPVLWEDESRVGSPELRSQIFLTETSPEDELDVHRR
jgi:hypothetical protein